MTTSPVDKYFPEWTVADRLRRIRRDAKLTQEAFADRIGLVGHHQRYAAWETGRNQPPMSEFIVIAKRIHLAFGVAPEWTLGLEMSHGPEGPGGLLTHAAEGPKGPERARRYSKPQPSDPKVLPLHAAA